ncbi:hypothetical protein HJC23_007799 [Cyclotella cryptica]|uniref:Ankyrin n=1 Tax=Cyclotella cryptica TaxID=29204 RepID=A0ABD3R054_9STRA|eukprot:CCRYP_000085-RA/>CCRYP_000085-RA protein AED:0.16 eAED:0.16 QI:162/1/1/1/1/1/4/952/187
MTTKTLLLTILTLLSAPLNPTLAELSSLDTQLFEAAANEDISAALSALTAGANINARSERGLQTPLMQSVLFGRGEMVKFFLEQGADTTIGERDGYTPMHGAGFQGRAGIAEMLKNHGVPLRDKHHDGYEPAIRSCWGPEERHTEALKWFIDNGVPVEEIYDVCMASTSNEQTKKMLRDKKEAKDEL